MLPTAPWKVLTTILTALGCETVVLQPDPAGVYRTATDVREACLPILAEQVRRSRADLGVLLVSNGECLILVDEEGTVGWRNSLRPCFPCSPLKYGGAGTIPLPVTAPRFIEEVIKANRGAVVRTKASPRALMEKVQAAAPALPRR